MFIVNLDKLNIGELFEVRHERARNGVQRPIGLATTCQIDMCDTIGRHKPAVARESIEHQCKTLVPFNIARSFEEFIQDGTQHVL